MLARVTRVYDCAIQQFVRQRPCEFRLTALVAHVTSVAKQHPRRELPLRIDRALDATHLVDARPAVELLEQLLLDRIAADAVLGER